MKKKVLVLLFALTFLCSCSAQGLRQKFFKVEDVPEELKKGADAVDLPVENSSDTKLIEESAKDFFEEITNQVKRDWETDARLYSIQGVLYYNDMRRLTALNHYYPWDITYISPSRKRMITISLPEPEENMTDMSKILYPCKNTRTEEKDKALIKNIKTSIEYKMDEEDIAKDASAYTLSNTWFTDWETDFNRIGQIVYEHVKQNVKNPKIILTLYFTGKSGDMGFNTPVWEASWTDSRGGKRLFIIDAFTGEILMDT